MRSLVLVLSILGCCLLLLGALAALLDQGWLGALLALGLFTLWLLGGLLVLRVPKVALLCFLAALLLGGVTWQGFQGTLLSKLAGAIGLGSACMAFLCYAAFREVARQRRGSVSPSRMRGEAVTGANRSPASVAPSGAAPPSPRPDQ